MSEQRESLLLVVSDAHELGFGFAKIAGHIVTDCLECIEPARVSQQCRKQHTKPTYRQ